MARLLLALLIATNVLTLLALSHDELARLGHLVAGSYVVVGWWLVTAAVLLWVADRYDRRARAERTAPADGVHTTHRQGWVVVIILILGFMFRSAALDRLPWGYAGIHIDAAYNSELAFRILDRTQPFGAVMPSLAYVRDFLTPYYLAPFFAL